MQTDRHHLGLSCGAFGVERVETVFQIEVKLLARIEALGCGKPHVIGVERIGDDQLVFLIALIPVGQIIGITVGDVIKSALLTDQIHSVDRTAPGIPAFGTLAGDLGVQIYGCHQIGALIFRGIILIFDPFQPVAGDFPVCRLHRCHLCR